MSLKLDWSQLDTSTPEGLARFQRGCNRILRQADRFHGDKKLVAALQHFTVTGDIPNVAAEIVDSFYDRQQFDRSYELLYRVRDMSGTGQDHFHIATTSEGFSFPEVVEGERIPLRRWEAGKTTIYARTYADAVGWTEDVFRYRKVLDIEEGLAQLEAAYEAKKASDHYGLIEAIPDQDGVSVDVSYQTSSEDTQPFNDALTIQTACAEIDAALTDKGYNIGQESTFYIVARRSAFAWRLNRALQLVGQSFAGSPRVLTYNVQPILTNHISSTSYFYIVYPGMKLQTGYWLPLEVRFGGEVLELLEYARGVAQYNMGCAETDQMRRLATS